MKPHCSVDGCLRPAKTRGMCGAHAERMRNGRPIDPPIRPRLIDFETLVEKRGDCWLWTGSISSEGYGRYGHEYTHRLMYERYVGPIPEGLHLDHLCRNRICCNPTHLEPVTSRENFLRGESPGARALRTNFCKRGHEFTPENTIHKQGYRTCRACTREVRQKECPECGEVRSAISRHLRLVHNGGAA